MLSCASETKVDHTRGLSNGAYDRNTRFICRQYYLRYEAVWLAIQLSQVTGMAPRNATCDGKTEAETAVPTDGSSRVGFKKRLASLPLQIVGKPRSIVAYLDNNGAMISLIEHQFDMLGVARRIVYQILDGASYAARSA